MKLAYNNNLCYVIEGTNEQIAEIIEVLSYNPKGMRYWKEEWRKAKTMFRSKYNCFATGLIPYIQNKVSFEIELEDKRNKPDLDLQEINLWNEKTKSPLELRDYQLLAIEALVKESRGIIKLATGSGKTACGIGATQRLNKQTLFVVHRQDLLKQTYKEYKNKMRIEPGIIGDGKCELKKITVATIQSLHSLIQKDEEVLKWLKEVEFVIFDEVHRASRTYQEVASQMKNAYWRLGLSATALMGEKENKFMSMALTGPIIYEVKMSKLVEEKHIAKPKAFFIENILPETQGEWDEIYNEGIVYNEERNIQIAIIALKMLKRGKSSLVLIEKLDHGYEIEKLLKDRCRVKYVHGQHTSDSRQEALQDFQAGHIDVLIASRIFNEGVDIPLLECVIVASGWKSPILSYQRYGRGTRKTALKESTTIIDFVDEQWYINADGERRKGILYNHSLKRFGLCKKDKAFEVKIVKLEEI